jgi:hypothetical protein
MVDFVYGYKLLKRLGSNSVKGFGTRSSECSFLTISWLENDISRPFSRLLAILFVFCAPTLMPSVEEFRLVDYRSTWDWLISRPFIELLFGIELSSLESLGGFSSAQACPWNILYDYMLLLRVSSS